MINIGKVAKLSLKNIISFFNPCNIYILLWIGYEMCVDYHWPTVIARLCYYPIILMNIYYFYKLITKFKLRGAIKSMALFFIVMCVYGFVLVLLNNATGIGRTHFLFAILLSLGPIFTFYYFSTQGMVNEKNLSFWIFPFLAVAWLHYNAHIINMAVFYEEHGGAREEITNSFAYPFAGLIGYVFFFRKKPIIQYLILIFISFYLIMGMKRGAILCGALCLLWFLYLNIGRANKKKRLFVMILSVVSFIVGWKFLESFSSNSLYFQQRLDATLNGDSSQRDIQFAFFWNHYINNNNIIQFFFGEGAYHTETILGVKAHNDWLELLIDCGLFGALIYLLFFVNFMITWLNSKRDYVVYGILGSCFFFMLVRSIVSMGFTDLPLYTSLLMGYCFWKSSAIKPIQNRTFGFRFFYTLKKSRIRL